nr:hypothetical protein [Salmonid herpesvirus 1]
MVLMSISTFCSVIIVILLVLIAVWLWRVVVATGIANSQTMESEVTKAIARNNELWNGRSRDLQAQNNRLRDQLDEYLEIVARTYPEVRYGAPSSEPGARRSLSVRGNTSRPGRFEVTRDPLARIPLTLTPTPSPIKPKKPPRVPEGAQKDEMVLLNETLF